MGRTRTVDTNLPEGIRQGRTPGTLEVRVSLPAAKDADGRLRHREMSRTVHGGIREAKAVRAQLLTERDRRWGSEGSLTQQINRWFDSIEHDHSPNTMTNYRAYLRRYIGPDIGATKLKKLTTRSLDDFYDTLRQRGLAPATVRQCHSIIRKALAEAVRQGDLPVNPATNARTPQLVAHDIDPPDPALYQRIYDAACARRDGDLTMATFIRTAAGTGARRAEVCGLRISDINPDDRSLLIARAIVDHDGRLEARSTKTKRPRRIALDPIVIESLAAQIRYMHNRAQSMGFELAPNAYIFSDELDGTVPWRPDRVSLAFYRICRKLGVKVRLHDLRHMHATQLLTLGLDVRTVSGRLGHAQPAVTLNVYAHFVPAADRAAADILGGVLHTAALPAAPG